MGNLKSNVSGYFQSSIRGFSFSGDENTNARASREYTFNPLYEALVLAAGLGSTPPEEEVATFNPLYEALVLAAGYDARSDNQTRQRLSILYTRL